MKIKKFKPSVTSNCPKMEVDLEEAMDIAGAGKYQIFHCALMLSTLTAALLEMIGYAFILPAAACELHLPEHLRGLITSIPNIGIILTAPLWGGVADHFGRKPTLLFCSAACGVVSFVAAFMPNLLSFALCKLAGALFMSCPTSLSFAYAGEMAPRRRRDLAVLVCNGFLTLSTTFSPLLAWAVLSGQWQFYIGSLSVRPWRLLTAVYALPLILSAIWMTQAMESPKFLTVKGRRDEALEVLKHIYSVNTGLPKEKYYVLSLKKSSEEPRGIADCSDAEQSSERKNESACALLRPPHLKWFALTSFLMFGLYTSLNGLFLFATDTINKVLGDTTEQSGTLCVIMNQPVNQTNTGSCVDTISQETFIIMAATTAIYGALVLAASVAPLSKKTLLLGMYLAAGVASLLAGLLTNMVVAGIAMSALQITALGIGPLTAYTVELFPTSLRGTAVGAVLMFGRVGSVTGATIAGYLLAAACTATFYGFGGLQFVCAALSFLLPKQKVATPREDHLVPDNDNR
ncbi:uncharacterized protein LOC126369966 [Pectinophora gossypiella]|uniref:uncharacterized protein LOC126369966 n=1 Tax=Pectinophora gossypiella TaxID=13191 RepID=UPI00214EFE15|nr:uncharacterized protein LOC126369966 [Pectinophora gossypiella]